MMAKGSWRKQHDWQIEPVQFINKSFTGLKNLAATCYINSLLQQLFYIRNFSSQLMAIDSDKIEDK
jgi:ubiquitin C-terminal hydrolase